MAWPSLLQRERWRRRWMQPPWQLALKDATEETFDLKRPKIDLGEYRGEGPLYVIATVGFLFFAFTAWQAWTEEFGEGLGPKKWTTSDDYFNPDFDPYAGMNLKKDPKTGKPKTR
ncbi:unnamed protein product [Effrenium voratum]|nr:unnamed protein product [Effrenium voratum]